MVRAAEHRPGNHSAGWLRWRDNGTREFEAAMRTIAIVIVGKFGEHGLEVALIHHDHVVQTLCPNGPHVVFAPPSPIRLAI
jgi:hypothetical protein